MKFKEYKGLDLAGVAADVLGEWDARDTFHKSITTREGHPTFVFYEGPPSANGMPGIHHVMARTIKDIICRYKTQQGYLVHRKAGWDTHGLPVELGVEKKLGITKEDIGKIADLMLAKVNKSLAEKGITMTLTAAARDYVIEHGYDAEYGARPLRRVIEQTIEDNVAEKLIDGTVKENSRITVDIEKGGSVSITTEK